MTAPPPPQRTAAELVLALRVRADCISGQPWEAPATANMMREAADEIARLTAAVEEAEKNRNMLARAIHYALARGDDAQLGSVRAELADAVNKLLAERATGEETR